MTEGKAETHIGHQIPLISLDILRTDGLHVTYLSLLLSATGIDLLFRSASTVSQRISHFCELLVLRLVDALVCVTNDHIHARGLYLHNRHLSERGKTASSSDGSHRIDHCQS